MSKFINKILPLSLIILPLIFIPNLTNQFELAKQFWILLCAVILSIPLSAKALKDKKILLRIPVFVIALLPLLGILCISIFTFPGSKLFLLTNSEFTSLFISLIFVCVAFQLVTMESREAILRSILISSSFLGLFSLLQLIFPNQIPQQFSSQNHFTPIGSQFNLLLIMSIGTSYLLHLAYEHIKSDHSTQKYINIINIGLLLALHIIVIISSLGQIKSNPLILTPASASWTVMLKALNSSPLLGVAPGTYLANYAKLRPLITNSPSLWNIRFANANNLFFHFATISGILGLLALSMFIFFAVKTIVGAIKNKDQLKLTFPAVIALLFFIVAPFGIVSMTLCLICLAIISPLADTPQWKINSSARQIILILTLIPLGLLLVLFSILIQAEAHFHLALQDFENGNIVSGYNQIHKATETNPNQDSYHNALASSSLNLANFLAKKKEPTDQDRENIKILISQAIEESKAALRINPVNSRNWFNLYQIYYRILSSVNPDQQEAAQNTALEVLSQSINLDPNNPLLYLELGDFHYNFDRFDKARTAYTQAINLKPDLTRGFYALYLTYTRLNNINLARTALEKTIELLPDSSPDKSKLQQELGQYPKPVKPEPESEFNPPPPLPTPFTTPNLELPNDSMPNPENSGY